MTAPRPLALLWLLTALGCRGASALDGAGAPPAASGAAARSSEPPPSAPAKQSDAGEPGALPPLSAESWLLRLSLPGGGAASVSMPLGATTRRPVLVALHGAGDRPEWACGGWRGVTDAYPFIVCPFGKTTQRGPEPSRVYVTAPVDQVTRDADEALAALRERFGSHLDTSAVVLAGFSLGAHRAAAMAQQPGRWAAVALLEGAYDEVTAPWASAARAAGSQRLLLGCSQGACASTFRGRTAALERAGLLVRLLDARLGVHNLNAEMVTALKEPFAWLVRGLPGWQMR